MTEQLIHGGDTVGFEARYGRPPLDFSTNTSPLGLPESVRQAVVDSLTDADRYPDPLCRKLSAAIGEAEGIPPEWVLCGNGAADLIFRIPAALRPKKALIVSPTFSEYELALAQWDCEIEHYILPEEQGFILDTGILNHIRQDTGLLFLCSPNNPTGQPVEPELLVQIAERCHQVGCRLVVDECFLDFLPLHLQHSVILLLQKHPNILVLKAFTKLYGMASLRLGYLLCADVALLRRLRDAGQPWAVSGPAQAAGLAALKDKEYRAQTLALIAEQRELLKAGIQGLGIPVVGSHANYLFFRQPVPNFPEKLAQKGILIRSCDNFTGMPPGYCRVAVRKQEENQILLDTIKSVLEG